MRKPWPLLAVAIASMLSFSVRTYAQSGTAYAFGDSQLDVRNICPLLGFPHSLGGCSTGLNTMQWLPSFTGYSFNAQNDYAVGGAGTGPTYPGTTSVASQIAAFTAAGGRIGPNDLVILDGATLGFNAMTTLNLSSATAAQLTLGEQQSNVANLIKDGARNVVVYTAGGPGLQSILNIGLWNGFLQKVIPGTTPPGADDYAVAYNAGLGKALAPFAGPGTQIRVFDFFQVYARAIQTPSLYGFVPGSCGTDPACVNAPPSVQNQHFNLDVHETQAGHELMARYIGNLLGAQDALPAQADISQSIALAFTNSIFGRLNAFRQLAPTASPRDSYAADMSRKAPALAPVQLGGGWSAYATSTYIGGNHDDRLSPSGLQSGGGDFNSGGGTMGLEYRFTPNLVAGAAINYTGVKADLRSAGTIDVGSIHFAGYASATYAHWFFDGILAYGHQNFDISRPGIIDVLHASISGDSYVAATKGGYLFDIGMLRAGPIGGLSYVGTGIGGYTENGDSILTQHVDRQFANQLLASAGIEMTRRFSIDRTNLNAFVDLTAERNLLNGNRWITSEETVALALPIWTPAGNSNATYGRITGGLAANLSNGWSSFLTTTTTFARAGGNDYGASGGVKLQF